MKLQEKKREMKKEPEFGFIHLLKYKLKLLIRKSASVSNYEK